MMVFSYYKKFMVRPIGWEDSACLAGVHNRSIMNAWSAESFDRLLQESQGFGFATCAIRHPKKIYGFVLAQMICEEAEILTLVVDPAWRRRTLGYALMDAVMQHLHRQRASALFLEVDSKNSAAKRLYAKFGFTEFGRRAGYYATKEGRSDALMMRCDFNKNGKIIE